MLQIFFINLLLKYSYGRILNNMLYFNYFKMLMYSIIILKKFLQHNFNNYLICFINNIYLFLLFNFYILKLQYLYNFLLMIHYMINQKLDNHDLFIKQYSIHFFHLQIFKNIERLQNYKYINMLDHYYYFFFI